MAIAILTKEMNTSTFIPMKNRILAVLALLVTVTASKAQVTKVDLQVAGLTCSMCSKATDKQLRSLDFVEDIDIDLSHATFILHFKKDKAVDFSQIKKKVEDAGFFVASLKVFYKFENTKIEKGSSITYQNSQFVFLNTKTQVLNGELPFKIIDKGYVSEKESKKNAADLALQPKMEVGKQTYHITL
jgi:copper chaperone CopZ